MHRQAEMATVVVIDDDRTVRLAMARMLEFSGFHVLDFEDARPALDEVDFSKADLIVTDLQMPTPGDELLRVLRQRGIKVPVVVVSGILDDEAERMLKELGADRTMSKPFLMSELVEVARELTGLD